MSPKSRIAFVCTSCGQEFSKWQGKCHACGAWDTISEFRQPAGKRTSTSHATPSSTADIVSLAQFTPQSVDRIASGFSEFDRVLGEGLVPGSVILLGGEPGIGKSTLLLQLTAQWAATSRKVVYVSGEESLEQISIRAHRLALQPGALQVLPETCLETILARFDEFLPSIVVIDSIQTLFSGELESAPGTVSQVRESAAALLRFAKKNGTTMFLIGHVTKEGDIAGPRVLEHMVDTVLYFEGDSHNQYRLVRAVKNRFGPSGEIAIFSMSDRGLREVSDPSELFVINRAAPQIGAAVSPVLEGSRTLLIELQSLVNRSPFGMPQRVASGINPKRLSLLLAVLERYGGIHLGDHDVFFNIAGGLTVAEPAVDLGAAAAILSSFRGKSLRPGLAFIGELGLGGDVRPVNKTVPRLKELGRRGFAECILAELPGKGEGTAPPGLKLIPCAKVAKLADLLW